MIKLDWLIENIGAILGIFSAGVLLISKAWKPFKRNNDNATQIENLEEWREDIDETVKEIQADIQELMLWRAGREEAIKKYYDDKKESDRKVEKILDAVNELGQKVYALISNKH